MKVQTRLRRRERNGDAPGWASGLHPVVERVYRGRGIQSPTEIEHKLAHLPDPARMGGMQPAVELLESCLLSDARILVVGDFDADGATGTATAVLGLRMLGARNVSYRVPNRFTHGYGLSPELVADLAPQRPDLLITVDNGISSHAGVAAARAAGMRVLITDHHLPGATLPAADALIDPNVPGCGFPTRCLAGVGVVFYLLLALRKRLRESGGFAQRGVPEPDLSELLDLVAMGTVADLVPLDFTNRCLVEGGLKRIRSGRARPGILALAEVSKRNPERLAASDFAFALAPRLNAAGRLEDMALGIECLIADNLPRARRIAQELDSINAERREVQDQMQAEAEAMLARAGQGDVPLAPCLYDPGWHAGVVGLIASKVKERLHRPVLAFAPGDDDAHMLKGSGRSIPGFHLRDALADVAAAEPGLIERFGGHAMAAGLSLRANDLDRFRATFARIASVRLDGVDLEPVIWSDGELAPDEFDLDTAVALERAGPFGQAFPEPVFDNRLQLVELRSLGSDGRHLRLRLRHPERSGALDAVWFNGAEHLSAHPGNWLQVAYQWTIDDYRGEFRPRMLVRGAWGA